MNFRIPWYLTDWLLFIEGVLSVGVRSGGIASDLDRNVGDKKMQIVIDKS